MEDDSTFIVGDSVIYTGYGVCRITGIQDRTVNDETCPFFILKPVFEEQSTLYIPVDNVNAKAKMRRILSADEIYAVIRELPDVTNWIENENERKEQYEKILSGTDRSALVTLVIALHMHKQEQMNTGKGKKLSASDEQYLTDAENALYDEFAYVLDINRTNVLPFIFDQIDHAKN